MAAVAVASPYTVNHLQYHQKKSGRVFFDSPIDAQYQTLSEVVALFEELESADPEIAENAKKKLELLKEQGFTSDTLIMCSLPYSPHDAQKLGEIALNNSKSSDPLLQERAFQACKYLVSHHLELGNKAAVDLAHEMMHSNDAGVQKRGIEYFTLLFMRRGSVVAEDDLALAIGIAKAHASDPWGPTTPFFKAMVLNGTTKEVLRLGVTLLMLSNSNIQEEADVGLKICEEIARWRPDAIKIALAAAKMACGSENQENQISGLGIFKSLFFWRPEHAIEPLIEALKNPAKTPHASILQLLTPLADHSSRLLTVKMSVVVVPRAVQDAPKLLAILEDVYNNAKPAYIKNEAQRLVGLVQARLPQD